MKIISEQSPMDQVTIVEERQIKKENQLMGSMRLQPGQTCWQLNLETFEVTTAIYKNSEMYYEKNERGVTVPVIKKSIQMKEKHMYEVAINKKNAQKKFEKRLAAVGFDYKF